MSKKWATILKILLSLVLLVFVLSQLSLAELWNELKNANLISSPVTYSVLGGLSGSLPPDVTMRKKIL